MTMPETLCAPTDRRTFLKTLGAAGAATLAYGVPVDLKAQTSAVRLGLDMYSVNAQQWTPFQQLDFAAKWHVKMVHFRPGPYCPGRLPVSRPRSLTP